MPFLFMRRRLIFPREDTVSNIVASASFCLPGFTYCYRS